MNLKLRLKFISRIAREGSKGPNLKLHFKCMSLQQSNCRRQRHMDECNETSIMRRPPGCMLTTKVKSYLNLWHLQVNEWRLVKPGQLLGQCGKEMLFSDQFEMLCFLKHSLGSNGLPQWIMVALGVCGGRWPAWGVRLLFLNWNEWIIEFQIHFCGPQGRVRSSRRGLQQSL